MEGEGYLPSVLERKSRPSKRCQLDLQLNQQQYVAGEMLQAEVRLTAVQEFPVRRLRWHLFGGEYVQWETEVGNVNNKMKSLSTLLDNQGILYEHHEGTDFILLAGEGETWTLECPLPVTLSPSYQTEHAFTRYYIRAILETDEESSVQTVVPFYIDLLPVPAQTELLKVEEAAVDSTTRSFWVFGQPRSESRIAMRATFFPYVMSRHVGLNDGGENVPPAMNHISINLALQSDLNYAIREVRFQMSVVVRISVNQHDFADRDTILNYTHRLDPPLEPHSSKRYNINVPFDPDRMRNQGTIGTSLVTLRYIFSIFVGPIVSRVPFHVHTIPGNYVPQLVWEESVVEEASPEPTKERGAPGEWDVESVQVWLRDVGFDRYSSQFEQHEIDGQALRLLSEEHLREMGVRVMGDRLKLLRAIRELSSRPRPDSVKRRALNASSDSIESHRINSRQRRNERLLNSPLRTSA